MIKELKALAEKKGDKLEIVSIDRLTTMKEEIDNLQNEKPLNGMQKWIINNLYKYNYGKETFTRRSVIIIAVPFPAAYANVIFNRNGKEYRFYATVGVSFAKTSKYITDIVRKAGHKIKFEGFLPLKRLAVQSGLAEYGKNNITYVKDMGSFVSYTAYSTDIPCEEDNWRDVIVSPMCENCEICMSNCPTGAIRKDEFIIDCQRCLSAMNEDKGDFPDWLPYSAHHTPFDCLKCQVCCPMNAGNLDVIDVSFDEAETERILNGAPYKDVSKDLKKKIDLLKLDKWASIPRNLQVLFNVMDKGHSPTL